jgi:hypothetical protein
MVVNAIKVVYDFKRQLRKGEAYERHLDVLFAVDYSITPATHEQQRAGIDRIFTRRIDGKRFTIEYKADSKAGATGNAFIETTSVDTTSKAGWATSSQADILVYLVTEPQTIYCIALSKLRTKLERWQRKYREVAVRNKGYRTIGLLVPLHELEAIADCVF